MNILLSGSSGLVRRALIAFMTTKGYVVTRLLRPQSGPGDVRWDPVRGPVNVVAPGAVTNEEFTKTLGRVLGRPTLFPMPAFVARKPSGMCLGSHQQENKSVPLLRAPLRRLPR